MEPLLFTDMLIPAEWRSTILATAIVGEMIANSPEVERTVSAVKIFAAVATTALAIGIAMLLVKIGFFPVYAKTAKAFLFFTAGAEKEKALRAWERIRARVKRGGDADLRLAVIEADHLLDAILKRIGFAGKTMGERLERVKPWQLANISDIWVAHKMRNRLVHEPGTRITHYEAEIAIATYEKALRALGILD